MQSKRVRFEHQANDRTQLTITDRDSGRIASLDIPMPHTSTQRDIALRDLSAYGVPGLYRVTPWEYVNFGYEAEALPIKAGEAVSLLDTGRGQVAIYASRGGSFGSTHWYVTVETGERRQITCAEISLQGISDSVDAALAFGRGLYTGATS